MESEREYKQNYLRENILEKNYDAEEFLKFITDIKGDEAGDVDIWEFDELKQVVNNFISNHTEDIEPRTNNNDQHYGSDDEKAKPRYIHHNISVNQKSKKYIFQCLQM
jgi:hypothetical protein